MHKTPSFSQKLNKNFYKKWLKLGVFSIFHFQFLAKHGVFEDWVLGRGSNIKVFCSSSSCVLCGIGYDDNLCCRTLNPKAVAVTLAVAVIVAVVVVVVV